jgi:phosphoglucosamine mutase
VRGVSFDDFTLDLAGKIGSAVGSRHKVVVIGRDARLTSPMFSHAVSSALMGVGANVSDAGIVTTPTLAYAARHSSCGVMITASHNPPEYNGIKLWNPDGSSFDTGQMEDMEAKMAGHVGQADWKSVGSLSTIQDATEDHKERILSIVGGSEIKVVVDCANGPASQITPAILKEMGCNVITINAQLDGSFPGRPAEPAEENLSALKDAVAKLGADLGIAHDGDADRMVAIDDRGRFAGGDVLLKVFAKESGAKSMVAPVDATMLLDDWFGANLYRTRVGDAYISEEVKRTGADFGGEPSGTWIFPKVSLCPDGVFAAAKLVEMVSERKLSEMMDETPSLPMLKETLMFEPSKREAILSNLKKGIPSLKALDVDTTDGFKLGFGDGWALVRLSGTEPKMRIVVEARAAGRAKEIMMPVKEVAERCLR